MSTENVYKNRRANLITILEGFRTQKEFAAIADIKQAQISQLTGNNEKYKCGSEVARRIEKAAAKPDGWLDINHGEEVAAIESLDLIIRTVSIVNDMLKQYDVSPEQMNRAAYEDILRNTINTSVKLNVVTPEQVQHSLFSSFLKKETH